VPIRRIYERWVSKFAEHWAITLLGLKESLVKPQGEAKVQRSRKEGQA
jgi:hypothetical protein